MATSQATMDFLLDQLSGLTQVATKKMFGEYCVYLAGKPVGFVCDDQLYLKMTRAGRALAPQLGEGVPYPNAKPYLLVTADFWEDRAWLIQLFQVTENELPAPKLRKKDLLHAGAR